MKKIEKKELKEIKNILDVVLKESKKELKKAIKKLIKQHQEGKLFKNKKDSLKARKVIKNVLTLMTKKQIVSISKILEDKNAFVFLTSKKKKK